MRGQMLKVLLFFLGPTFHDKSERGAFNMFEKYVRKCSTKSKMVENGICPIKKVYNAICPINIISKKLDQLQHRPKKC